MRQLLLLAFGLTLLSPDLSAQSKYFIPFGQSVQEVRTFLTSRDYAVSVSENVRMHTLSAELNEGKQIEYAFDDTGLHYATSVSKTYRNKREAIKFKGSCMDYMKMVSRGQVEVVEYDDITCHTALTSKNILKLFVISHGDTQTLQLTSISRTIGPGQGDQLLHYEASILDQTFATK